MIFADDSAVKIDSVILPGVIKSIEIKGDAIVDEQDVEGQSKKPKQATGYEDMKVNIELILEDSENMTKLQKLETIQNLFRPLGQEKPAVHELINEHTSIRGIKKVIFKQLTHKAENKKGQIAVTLEFWEYNTMIISASASSKKSKNKSKNKNSGSTAGNLNADYQAYLGNRGEAPSKSPAVDTAKTALLLTQVGKLPF